MKDLTVVILTHNRPQLLLETVQSALNQTCSDFYLVVSDNSGNDETKLLFEKQNLMGKLIYKKREKEYPSMEHFNLVINEIETKYFILFHDDDLMRPNYIETMYNEIADSEYSAVACNAYTFGDKPLQKRKIIKIKTDKIIATPEEFILYYLKMQNPPYPSYIYSKERLKGLLGTDEAGKHSDVTWMLNVLDTGKIKFVAQPLMDYRIHSGQDSSTFDYKQQLRLMKFFKDRTKQSSKHFQRLFAKKRAELIYAHAVRKLNAEHKMTDKRVYKILIKYSPFNYFPKLIIRKLLMQRG